MAKSRTQNAILNSLYGIASALIMIILNFAVRYFLVKTLGDEYYGLHSFFQSITNLFAMLELGISSAVIIHLYEPVKNEAYDEIKEIMSFYRGVYIKIAIIFSVVTFIFGISLLPFVVHTTIDMAYVIGYYLIFSSSFTFDFLTYHKRSILYADQKNRVSSLYTMLAELVFRGLQIVCLLIYPSYILFLILFIAEKLVSNALCNKYVVKHYPYLVNYKYLKIGENLKQGIIGTIKPLFVFQIATTIQGAIPSVLISILMGNISIVGYYANYQLVSSTMTLLYSQLGGAFTTSFGNLAVNRNIEAMENAYKKTAFLTNSIAIILFVGYISCIQDFIALIFGEHFLLPIKSVIVIGFLMIVSLFNVPMISIQNAMGLHRLDVRYMVFQAILSTILGFIGGKYFGVEGLFIGLLIPSAIFTILVKGTIISKYVFEWTTWQFFFYIIKDIIKLLLVGIVGYLMSTLVSTDYYLLNILIKGIIAVSIGTILIVCMSIGNPYLKSIIKTIYKK